MFIFQFGISYICAHSLINKQKRMKNNFQFQNFAKGKKFL